MPQEQFIPPCVTFNRKCSISSVSKRRFWPRKYSTEELFRIKIGSVFLCYFLLQSQKKVEQFDASKRCDEDARKFGPLCSPCRDGRASIKLVDVSILFPTIQTG